MATANVSNRKVTKTVEIDESVVTLELSPDEAQALVEVVARVGTSQFKRNGGRFTDSSAGNYQKSCNDIYSVLVNLGYNYSINSVSRDDDSYSARGNIHFYREDA